MPLGELFEEGNSRADVQLFKGSFKVAILKVSAQLDSPGNVLVDVVPSVQQPSESSKFLDPSTLQKVFDATKTMIDTLAGVHPAATVAWGFLSIGFDILKNRRGTKQAMFDLYADMISAYENFSKDDGLDSEDPDSW